MCRMREIYLSQGLQGQVHRWPSERNNIYTLLLLTIKYLLLLEDKAGKMHAHAPHVDAIVVRGVVEQQLRGLVCSSGHGVLQSKQTHVLPKRTI